MKQERRLYGLLAIVVSLFFFGGLLRMEQEHVNLVAALLFCIVCSILLLFALIKLRAMEFQPDSIWYRIEQIINREETPLETERSAVHNLLSVLMVHK